MSGEDTSANFAVIPRWTMPETQTGRRHWTVPVSDDLSNALSAAARATSQPLTAVLLGRVL